MLFRKSLIQEMSWVALGAFFVLLMLIMTTQIVRLLGQAAIGALASSAVWAMMGFAAVRYLPILLSLMLFFSILAVLTRLWKDHEMVIWFVSGRSIMSFIRPVLEFTIPVVILIALLSLVLSPWALEKGQEYKEKSLSRQEVTQVAPGVFRESPAADRVYFVENFTGGNGNNVFVQLRRDEKLTVILAEKGGLYLDSDGSRWLWLAKGKSYEGLPGTAAYETLEFENARLRIEAGESPRSSPSTQATSTMALWNSKLPEHQAELAWRIAIPISALILSLAAIPLAFFNPRGGRASNLLVAIFSYFFYYNCINIAQAWLSDGKIPLMLGMWPLHAAALLITLGLFAWRGKLRGS
ncbi:LPS export ABC transporter permease LptF [Iodobacter fluviatilis]|uniref:Lipopolysaccharide export system permease protein LptF n=1 Tax=Iodobacter fluviatilis TaxID=537 RepID=A0A377SYP3_9NEIS|nr:LPS export ABC transporter permease LptF [Iodobacter fluviatilis]TCU88129.1 lipopolysaccharide export system permease protein [Iodobacter fluviatilis]STR45629.1 Lipopolysaccharide export system permease protein lptF [Iodobacter fluviatilis]